MEPENLTPLPTTLASDETASDLRSQCDALRQLVHSLLVILLMISGTFLIFLYWQVHNANRELENAGNIIYQYQHTAGPTQDKFVQQLQEFGQHNPDYARILKKYNIPPPGTPPPAAAVPGKK